MRQLIVNVPRGCGETVLKIAKSYDGANLALWEGTADDKPIDVVIVHVSNGKVEGLLAELEHLPSLRVTLLPVGVMALQPPADEAPQQVKDVQERSPIEIFLAGLQSIGSWKSFLAYATVAGVVVWIGLYVNISYLQVAAMLIAPFAGPAMNVAIATARGDGYLLRRGLLRYFAALAVTILVTAALSLIMGQEVATTLMVERSQISSVAVLLPLTAGAAGALFLINSERSSLVSGAAVGVLVAASLAPPAGLVGMASAIGRWDLAINGVFVLLLQLVGINLSAAIVFRLYGLSPQGTRYDRGKQKVFISALAATLLGLSGLLTWQFWNSPNLQRSTIASRATSEIQKVVDNYNTVKLVETNVRFARADIKGENTLLGVVYVQRQAGVNLSSEKIRSQLTSAIQTHLLQQGFNLTPLIDVSVLEAPNNS